MSATPSPGSAWRDAEFAAPFLEERRHLIPALEVQEALIAALLARIERPVERFLDLGAGAGAFSELVMTACPEATGVLVDFSEPMVAEAERRLADSEGRWQYVRADLSQPSWRDALPSRGREHYDAVVSSFCIHHLPDERKRDLYQEAFDLLEPGGIFLNWEHVAGDGTLVEGMFEQYMIGRVIELEQQRPDPRPAEEVARAFRERAANDGDILLDPETQCEWLREIGFRAVDTFFKLPELALFGGRKEGR
jgi:ubiquinone/menaquinone biosynthesis C-methylase UbiE